MGICRSEQNCGVKHPTLPFSALTELNADATLITSEVQDPLRSGRVWMNCAQSGQESSHTSVQYCGI